ncbi:hypothetical protein lerEdw1_001099 [Lerista edwardsae]|nr:hypothetical protein lerEdw1_001099 [Lerista edwardsae]
MVGPARAPSGGGAAALENANPLIYRRQGERPVTAREEDDELPDAIDSREIFDILWLRREGALTAASGGQGRGVGLLWGGPWTQPQPQSRAEPSRATGGCTDRSGQSRDESLLLWASIQDPACLFFLDFLHLIRSINDPEHPLTLEELNVVEQVRIKVNDAESTVSVEFTPTIPHCSMATLIGLSIKVKLIRSLPERFKVDVHITPGTHASEHAVNKQLADKERVAAALENTHLLEVVNQCLSGRP